MDDKKNMDINEDMDEEIFEEEQAPFSEIDLLKEELSKTNDKLLRTIAEYDNFRKRSIREKETIYPEATANTVKKFLPIMDSFERALAVETTDVEFKKGVEMIFSSFKEQLTSLNVEIYGTAGDIFDPILHNAVMHIEDDEKDNNEITEVFQKGYKIGDLIIRHAMVKVAN